MMTLRDFGLAFPSGIDRRYGEGVSYQIGLHSVCVGLRVAEYSKKYKLALDHVAKVIARLEDDPDIKPHPIEPPILSVQTTAVAFDYPSYLAADSEERKHRLLSSFRDAVFCLIAQSGQGVAINLCERVFADAGSHPILYEKKWPKAWTSPDGQRRMTAKFYYDIDTFAIDLMLTTARGKVLATNYKAVLDQPGYLCEQQYLGRAQWTSNRTFAMLRGTPGRKSVSVRVDSFIPT